MKKTIILGLGISLLSPVLVSADAAGECRGIAIGIVSSMKAKDEVKGEEASQAALLAARRACIAVLENYTDEELTDIGNEESSTAKKEEEKKMSTWDLLTQDQEEKPGNKRLKRLRN